MKIKNVIATLIISLTLISCNGLVSKEKLVEKVKSDINSEFSKRASAHGINYTIKSFDLIHKGGKEYSGILKTSEDGEEYTYEVSVTTDGDSYMWKIIE